jgi:hypothetical protein
MVQLTLKSREHCGFEFPCDDTVESLSVRAIGGKCIVAIQSSRDGLTWSSPVAHARLGSEPTTVRFTVPSGTLKLRALVENTSHRPAHVEIDDPSESDDDVDNATPESHSKVSH